MSEEKPSPLVLGETVEQFVRRFAREWCIIHIKDSRHVRIGFAVAAVKAALEVADEKCR